VKWRGPKTKGWEKALRELKAQFLEWGITWCELMYPGCQRTEALGFAHALKRSQHPEMYKTEELKRVALACNSCHDQIERMAALEMERIVARVIELRWKALSLTSTSFQPPGS
jgi:hypothetical protein